MIYTYRVWYGNLAYDDSPKFINLDMNYYTIIQYDTKLWLLASLALSNYYLINNNQVKMI